MVVEKELVVDNEKKNKSGKFLIATRRVLIKLSSEYGWHGKAKYCVFFYNNRQTKGTPP